MTQLKLETQIDILKKKQRSLVYQSKAWYALDGKIKKQQNILDKLKQFEFLAR